MKIKVEFFKDQIIDSIDAGIYEIILSYADKKCSLYIGESVHVLVRSAIHLYRLKMNPSYFGLTDKTINNQNLKLSFRLLENVKDKSSRKSIELEYIKLNIPITQNDSNDKQLSTVKKVEAVNKFLNKGELIDAKLY